MSIIMQIRQLITPLRNDPQRILQERDNDQKPPDSREVRLNRVGNSI